MTKCEEREIKRELTFSVAGPRGWNALSAVIVNITELSAFTLAIKRFSNMSYFYIITLCGKLYVQFASFLWSNYSRKLQRESVNWFAALGPLSDDPESVWISARGTIHDVATDILLCTDLENEHGS